MALTKITPQMFDTSAAGHDFNIDNGTFVVDASANRVGIGTATPGQTFHVVGGSATAALLINDGSNGDVVRIGKAATDVLKLRAEGTADGVIDASGGSMILKTGGTAALTIDGSQNTTFAGTLTSSTITVNAQNAAGGVEGGEIRLVGATGDTDINLDNYNGIFRVYDGNSLVRLTLDTSGNVGIGPSSATGALHVSRSGLEAGITLERTSSATAKFTIAANDGNLTFTDAANSAERMRINSSGNVGINTTNVSAIFEVRATVPTYTNNGTVFWGGTTNNDSHTGISLNSAGDALFGSVGSNIYYSNSATAAQSNTSRSSGEIQFSNTTTSSVTSSILFGGYVKGSTTFTERMRIDSSGRVSFGPDAADIQIDPASTNSGNNLIYMRGNASNDKSSIQLNHYGVADYHIGVGHVGSGKFNIANDQTGNDFVIDTAGNIGIGTDSPIAKLDVRGQGLFHGSTGSHVGTNVGAITINSNVADDIHDFSQGLVFTNNTNGAGPWTHAAITTEGSTGYRGDLVFGTDGDGTNNTTAVTEKMRITAAGILQLAGGGNDNVGEINFGNTAQNANRLQIRHQSSAWFLKTVDSEPLLFGTANTERMRINSSGNVGIGTSTGVSDPVSRLNVRAANNHTTGSDREDLVTLHQGISAWQVGRGAGIRWVGDVSRTMAGISAYVFGHEQTGLAFETGGATSTGNLDPTTRMVIDHDGNVGIGTATPGYKLHVNGAAYIVGNLRLTTTGNTNTDFYVNNHSAGGQGGVHLYGVDANHSIFIRRGYDGILNRTDFHQYGEFRWYTNGTLANQTKKMDLTVDGELRLNTSTTNSAAKLQIRQPSGQVFAVFQNASSATIGYIGNVSNNSTLYSQSSDERLKTNIADSADAGSRIDAIQVRQFDWKADGIHQDYGMVAQELKTVAPEAVFEPENEEDMKGVDYSKLVPMLVKEIQSLRKRVSELEK